MADETEEVLQTSDAEPDRDAPDAGGSGGGDDEGGAAAAEGAGGGAAGGGGGGDDEEAVVDSSDDDAGNELFEAAASDDDEEEQAAPRHRLQRASRDSGVAASDDDAAGSDGKEVVDDNSDDEDFGGDGQQLGKKKKKREKKKDKEGKSKSKKDKKKKKDKEARGEKRKKKAASADGDDDAEGTSSAKKKRDKSDKPAKRRRKASTEDGAADKPKKKKASNDDDDDDGDDNFIDRTGDDAELMAEYDAEKQTFSSDEDAEDGDVSDDDDGHRTLGRSGHGKEEKEMDEDERFLHNIFNKPKNKAKPTEEMNQQMQQREEKDMEKLVSEMMTATIRDREALKQHRPALHKLSLLPRVRDALLNTRWSDRLVDKHHILGEIEAWLQPTDQGHLPLLKIRSELLDLLLPLRVDVDHLKQCNLGRVLVMLSNHAQETDENKRKAKAIIDKWMRIVLPPSSSSMAMPERGAAQPPPLIPPLGAPKVRQLKSLASALAPTDSKSTEFTGYHARVPQAAVFDFQQVPESKLAVEDGETGRADAKQSDKLKRLKAMRKTSNKPTGAAGMSIEGRGV